MRVVTDVEGDLGSVRQAVHGGHVKLDPRTPEGERCQDTETEDPELGETTTDIADRIGICDRLSQREQNRRTD